MIARAAASRIDTLRVRAMPVLDPAARAVSGGARGDRNMSLAGAKNEIDRGFTGDLKGLAYENAFAGAMSFLRRRYTKDLTGVDLVVTGVPFDQAVTHRAGSRMGPRAIREASCLQPFDPPYGWDGFDPLSEFAIIDYGDVAFDYAHTPSFPGLVTDHFAGILAKGPGTIAFGGDHFVTLPILRAYAAVHGPLAVIQFDAHSDPVSYTHLTLPTNREV